MSQQGEKKSLRFRRVNTNPSLKSDSFLRYSGQYGTGADTNRSGRVTLSYEDRRRAKTKPADKKGPHGINKTKQKWDEKRAGKSSQTEVLQQRKRCWPIAVPGPLGGISRDAKNHATGTYLLLKNFAPNSVDFFIISRTAEADGIYFYNEVS